MSFEEKFSKQIDSFQRYGTYTYEYDAVGNVIFNSSSSDFSQVYLALPLSNFLYNDEKIKQFYDPTFNEFIPQTIAQPDENSNIQSIQNALNEEINKNTELSQQLEEVLNKNKLNATDANKLASKQVILELRKLLGQGRVDSDFSEDFPFSPLRKNSNIISETSTEISQNKVFDTSAGTVNEYLK